MKNSLRQRSRRHGFSLVEVTLALGVASFCMLSVFGLLLTGVNSNRTCLEQTAASNLATRIASDLRATSSTNTSTPQFSVQMSGDTTLYMREDGSLAGSAANCRYRARVVAAAGPGGAHAPTVARIVITWPAAADPDKDATGVFETVVALNRN